MTPVRVSVIVPARQAARTLGRTLDAVRAQTAAGCMEVVVVDNGSRDATAALAREAGARVLSEPRPSAFRARNRAVGETTTPWLAFLDADCLPDPAWLEHLMDSVERGGAALGAGRTEYVPADHQWGTRLFVARKSTDLARQSVEHRGALASGNLLVARQVFETCGLFSEHPYSSDIAFSRRAIAAGFKAVFVEDARVEHLTSYSIRSYLARRVLTRRGQEVLGVYGRGRRRVMEVARQVPWRPGWGAVAPTAQAMAIRGLPARGALWMLLVAERWADYVGGLAGSMAGWRAAPSDDPS